MLYLKELHIVRFGTLSDITLPLTEGLNLITGPNEAGKSTVAAFIRFLFYGFSGKAERESRMPPDGSPCSGFALLESDGKPYRVERRLSGTSDRSQIIDLETNTPLKGAGSPGELFFGMPAEVYSNTAYFLQAGGGVVNGREAGEAIDNMLFGADESAGTQKALKKLDEARIALWYKNKKGGIIYELEKKREQLLTRRSRAEEASAEIISLTGQLEDTTGKLRASLRKSELLRGQLAAFEQEQARRNRERIRTMEQKAAALEKDLKTARSACRSDVLRALMTLGEEQNALQRSAEACEREAERCKADLSREDSDRARLARLLDRKDDLRDAAEELSGLKKSRRNALTASIACGVLCALAALSGIVLLSAGQTLPAWCLLGAGTVLLVIAAVCLIRAAGFARERKELLAGWELDGEEDPEQLISLAREAFPDMERARELLRSRDSYVIQRRKKQEDADALALKLGFSSAEEACETLAEREKHAAGLQTELEKQTALLQNARAMLPPEPSETPDAEPCPIPPDFDPAETKREYRFLCKASDALRERAHSCEVRLASLHASAESPAELTEQLRAVDARLDSCRERWEAYVLAYQAITDAGEDFRNSIAPRLSACAGHAMEILTDGKYSSLGVDPAFSVYYHAGNDRGTASAHTMSCGTRDAAYLSLRMAILELVCKKSPPPIVFDEAFVYYDDARLRSAMRLLAGIASGTQIILLSASDRELHALPSPCHTVSLA